MNKGKWAPSPGSCIVTRNPIPYLFRKTFKVIAEVVHCVEDVLLVEMRLGVECHFDSAITKDGAYSCRRAKDTNENASTGGSEHGHSGVINPDDFGSRGETAPYRAFA